MCTGSPTQTQQASPYGGNYGGLFGGGTYNPVGGYGPMGKGGQMGLSNPMGTAFGGNRPMVPPGYYQPQQDPTALANASPEGTVKQGTGFGTGVMQGGNMWQGGAPGSTFGGKTGPLGTTNPVTPAATTGGNMAWGGMYGGPQMKPYQSPWAGGGPWSSGGRMQPQWTVPPGGGTQPPLGPPPGYTPPPTTQPPVTQPPTTTPPPATGGGQFGGLSQQQQYLLAKQMGWNSPLNQQLLQQAGGESGYNALMNKYNANGVGAGQDAAYAQQLAMALNPNLPQATRQYNAGLLGGTPWAQYLK